LSVDALISRLEHVRRSGNGWTARCPAHADRTASLSVAVGDDGRVLCHCFAGCAVADVVAAVGLSVADLFAARLGDLSPMAREERRRAARDADWSAAVRVLARESAVALAAAKAIEDGALFDTDDIARLREAIDRIQCAREVLAA
jgi:hypothetical protein